MKKLFDFFFSIFLIIIFLPLIILISIIVFILDFNNPFYVAERVGKNFKMFKMIKFRSMIINADKNKVFSTKSDDERITIIGKYLRRFKLDELPQLFNILFGHMSFVGPRPNVKFEVDMYHDYEKDLLKIKPGITDLASIVFYDEAEILKNSNDPNKDYGLLIRPWKSQLGIYYVNNNNLILDIKIILFTILNFFNRQYVLNSISKIILKKTSDEKLSEICLRKKRLNEI